MYYEKLFILKLWDQFNKCVDIININIFWKIIFQGLVEIMDILIYNK